MDYFEDNYVVEKANDIFKDLQLGELLDNDFIQTRLAYRNSYKYYKLRHHNINILKINNIKLLKRLNEMNTASVYISIPFCLNRCYFCNIHKKTMENISNNLSIERYLNYLRKEISLLSQIINLKKMKIKHIYFGGGTPTSLSTGQFSSLIAYLNDSFNIDEFTNFCIETDPNLLKGEDGYRRLNDLKQLGFNRISIGVQDFNNEVLKISGRLHSADDNKESFYNARKVGFRQINLDLMYGLPGQTFSKWIQTIRQAVALFPESIDLYRLKFYHKSYPIYKLFMKNPGIFPKEKDLVIMGIISKETLSENDYEEAYPGLFIKKDIVIKHQYFNKKREIIGLGMDARGQFDDIKYYNDDRGAYLKKLDKNCLPVHKVFMLSKKYLMENDIITALVFIKTGLLKKEFRCSFGENIEKRFGRIISLLEKWELVTKGEIMRLTYKGALFSEDVFKAFCTEPFLNKTLVKLIAYLKRKQWPI
ncbi:MAG: coproporphyrinogen III oxidase family protein [Candidatus Omnitrophica bacterium]|nr:coproporphyrinogen III oxidase family protein [Candidatus Omnitrophota bacterium]